MLLLEINFILSYFQLNVTYTKYPLVIDSLSDDQNLS